MSMASLVRDAAALHPDKPALLDGQERYTFGELERLSTNFAAFLRSRGVQRGDRIAFASPKSATLIVAILGCLKAGATYVPIDPKLPRDRLLWILKDIAPRILVSSLAIQDAVAGQLGPSSRLIDERSLADHCRYAARGFVPLAIAAEDVAYCIYTSGSTGRPKGVLIQHGSVDAFFCALAEVMPITASSRCMNTSELHFDVHVMDVFFPLHRGATVHLSCGPLVAQRLLCTIDRERITHFTAVGPVMTLLTQGSAFERAELSSLERVMTGAEVLHVDTMQRWLAKVPGLTLVNGYGPTEATVICTAYLIDRAEPGRTELYPIGTPMLGTEVVLVDDDRVVTGPGATGELLLGGPQVMKGYWNDEPQTRERITELAGKRYYRSGDLCRWRPDGNLDYLGRNDEEIKLSGFRINLTEIKRVLDHAPGVEEGHAVVTVHPTLGKVIAACITRSARSARSAGADGEALGEALFANVQAALKRELPYYMVPSLYVVFDRFTMLASGKTDKRAMLREVEQCIRDADPAATRLVCAAPSDQVRNEVRNEVRSDLDTPEGWFHRRATLYVEAQILFHLNQVGVWSLLRQGGAYTAPQLAEILQLHPGTTEALLDYVLHVDDVLCRDHEQRYGLSEFGARVVDRFSDRPADGARPSINLFDVRIGAYGPVWQNLGSLLRGHGRYGEDVHRDGRFAEIGVSKLAGRFWDSLTAHIDEAGVDSVLEIGLTTGLLERLAARYPDHLLYGLDKSERAIDRNAASASARGMSHIRWIRSDYFDPDRWTQAVDRERRGLVYSLHFHELIAGGEHRFVEVLGRLKTLLPGWVVLAFEQPRLAHSERTKIPETQWLYAQSNVLIHHLIGNGRILSRDAWLALGRSAGCRDVTDRACHYLGYRAFTFAL